MRIHRPGPEALALAGRGRVALRRALLPNIDAEVTYGGFLLSELSWGGNRPAPYHL